MDYMTESLKKHFEWKGKLEVTSRVRVDSKEALSLAYTPGVAAPCLEIAKDESLAYSLTRKWNSVAVVTDGSAVLGLGNIGPLAGMPVMEGKCVLFREFAGIDAVPVCLATQDTEEIIATVKNIAPTYGGINLEDISAPRCFEIERRLKEICDIPVFHDDQHGTAIVLAAALENALKVVGKELSSARLVINGAGSAGIAITEFLLSMGARDVVVCDRAGVISEDGTKFNSAQVALAAKTNPRGVGGTLADAVKGADVFVGVSAKDVLSEDMVRTMAEGAIVFAMANPSPEIHPDLALRAGARVVATGRSDYPNQINNVLAFPGIFRGALDARARDINGEMQIAAVHALAGLVSDGERNENYILPKAFDPGVAPAVAEAVRRAAAESGVARI
ncbi:MAG TPA: NAD-dependent malic enzyme [Candidatus Limadaptatus stercorigallinarum]|uniref:NAD-dependent malic enzyme n=1 Tax=Candidatus Limadaptatus stercorigallinarum TaxID=2840845 RepID=A0A9D1HUQ3_9FIRM|nr:NAD-dependent malic enzyme [Candidatus Limadaptatus stercorigallinarum]